LIGKIVVDRAMAPPRICPGLARLAAAIMLASPAAAGAMEVAVTGQAGYLSEWEVTARARQITNGSRVEYAGPLVMKHVGLCTADGPVEKSGEIRFRRTGLMVSGIEATLSFGEERCTFAGSGAKTYDGVMHCPGTRGVPLSLQVK
jgi:hypothetical protein